jgi:hypothetical protein
VLDDTVEAVLVIGKLAPADEVRIVRLLSALV